MQPESLDTLIRDHVVPDLAYVRRVLEGERGIEESGLLSRMKKTTERVDAIETYLNTYVRPMVYLIGLAIPVIVGYIVLQFIQRGP